MHERDDEPAPRQVAPGGVDTHHEGSDFPSWQGEVQRRVVRDSTVDDERRPDTRQLQDLLDPRRAHIERAPHLYVVDQTLAEHEPLEQGVPLQGGREPHTLGPLNGRPDLDPGEPWEQSGVPEANVGSIP